jgi:hypothetical protein
MSTTSRFGRAPARQADSCCARPRRAQSLKQLRVDRLQHSLRGRLRRDRAEQRPTRERPGRTPTGAGSGADRRIEARAVALKRQYADKRVAATRTVMPRGKVDTDGEHRCHGYATAPPPVGASVRLRAAAPTEGALEANNGVGQALEAQRAGRPVAGSTC